MRGRRRTGGDGVSCGPDGALLEVFAGMVWHHRQARTDLSTGGYTTTNARGGEVSRPAWRVYRDTGREIAHLSDALGLSPTSRSRIVTGKDEPLDELDRLLSGG
ncbi:MAG: P27 family phage terminase small subunit [Candidatus Dormibacteria bacterium]